MVDDTSIKYKFNPTSLFIQQFNIYSDIDKHIESYDIKLMETLVTILYKWIDNLHSTTLKTVRKQLEVDFVYNKGSKQYYVQFAFAIPDNEKMQQESNSLLRICDSFKKKIVVKDSPAPNYTEDGILVVGVYDFLMNEDSMDM